LTILNLDRLGSGTGSIHTDPLGPIQFVGIVTFKLSQVSRGNVRRGMGARSQMDPVLVMFGCLICTMSALIFIEVRRIRKRLDVRVPEPAAAKAPASVS
jgi:hypothetical protein